ncbi:MAG: hypothetical protein RLZ47_450 [Bacteroidota bacterium]
MLIFTAFACSKEGSISIRELSDKTDGNLINKIKSEVIAPGIPFPDGSIVSSLDDNTMKIKLPKFHKFLMTNPNNGEVIEETGEDDGSEIGVTCNCTQGTGCSPVKYRRKYYCVSNDGCSTCVLKTSLISGEPIKIVGLYNPEEGVTVITKAKETGIKGALTSTKADLIGIASINFFKINKVKQALLDFYRLIYEDQIPAFILNNDLKAPAGYKYIAINIFGNEAAVPVPNDKLDGSEIIIGNEEADFKCKCNDVNGKGCLKKTFMGAQFCEAGSCHSCSLID